ncbi:MAG: hypothetical protein JWQ81_976 [Amycolatopsis sp.]|uniref:hypothetical protein n=1 Tax=Amycolatopsis sp. TaxID=37632 RepID=UPI00261AFD83|nr:hypothetical protein [Amycolatopsis sp.]MCU1680237.1 hypothetical protein [Amycolatopsis sp.]
MTAIAEYHHDTIDDPLDRLSQYYHGTFDWPTSIDSSTGEVHLRLGTVVDALIMRAGFAAEVNNFLVRHMFRVPIMVVPSKPADWVFLTGPRTTMRLTTWEDLVHIQVGWKRRSESLALPAPDGATEGLRWLQRPEPGMGLPPWTAVVGAARASSSLCGTW